MSTLANANKQEDSVSSVEVGYIQTQFQLLDDPKSKIQPNGYSLSLTQQLNPFWQLSLAYGDLKGKTEWPITSDGNDSQLTQALQLNSGDTQSKLVGVGSTWFHSDFIFSVSYANSKNDEQLLTRLPLTLSRSNDSTDAIELSIEADQYYEPWFVTWGIGLQYSRNTSSSLDTISANPPIIIEGNTAYKSLNAIGDLTLVHETQLMERPFYTSLNLSWNWSVNESTDSDFIATRGDQIRQLSNLNDRLFSQAQEANSGYVEFSITMDWNDRISTDLAYGTTMAAQLESKTFALSINILF